MTEPIYRDGIPTCPYDGHCQDSISYAICVPAYRKLQSDFEAAKADRVLANNENANLRAALDRLVEAGNNLRDSSYDIDASWIRAWNAAVKEAGIKP